ncbi:MAG: type IV pilus biogenesis/stability protein PilW [Pseudomonadota bacterium]
MKAGLTCLLGCLLAGALSACGTASAPALVTPGTGALQGSTTELKTASDQTPEEKRAWIRLQLAIDYYKEGNYDVALDEVKKALGARPDYPEAYGVRALIYTNMGEMALAEENYQHALRLAPRNPDISNNYGTFLCKVGRGTLAMPYFDAALNNRMYQAPARAMVNAGDCALKLKNYTLAERYLLDAMRYEPELPTIHAGLARVYFARRDYARAGTFINRLTELAKPETLPADVLWLAIRIERKLGEQGLETSLATQLRRRHPTSPEFAAFQRGAFDE